MTKLRTEISTKKGPTRPILASLGAPSHYNYSWKVLATKILELSYGNLVKHTSALHCFTRSTKLRLTARSPDDSTGKARAWKYRALRLFYRSQQQTESFSRFSPVACMNKTQNKAVDKRDFKGLQRPFNSAFH